LWPSLRIRGQLSAPIVNGGGDSFWEWPDFQLWRARDLDLVSGRTAYRRASLIIDLSYMPNFIEIEKTFCERTDVCTYARKDIWDWLY